MMNFFSYMLHEVLHRRFCNGYPSCFPYTLVLSFEVTLGLGATIFRHCGAKKSVSVANFVSSEYSRAPIFRILAFLEKGGSIEREPGSDRLTVLRDQKVQRALKRKTRGKMAKSFSALGREVCAIGQTVKKCSANMDIVIRKRKSKVFVREVFPAKRNMIVIMKDETYLTLDGNDWQGTCYSTSPRKKVSSSVKYISHIKPSLRNTT